MSSRLHFLSAIWLLENCQVLVKSLSDCSMTNFPMLAHNEKVFAKKWDLETLRQNVRPDLFQSSITPKCFIKFRPPEQIYVNFLMFNHFRPPTFLQILCWWQSLLSVR
jgi:hypothetical protein